MLTEADVAGSEKADGSLSETHKIVETLMDDGIAHVHDERLHIERGTATAMEEDAERELGNSLDNRPIR